MEKELQNTGKEMQKLKFDALNNKVIFFFCIKQSLKSFITLGRLLYL